MHNKSAIPLSCAYFYFIVSVLFQITEQEHVIGFIDYCYKNSPILFYLKFPKFIRNTKNIYSKTNIYLKSVACLQKKLITKLQCKYTCMPGIQKLNPSYIITYNNGTFNVLALICHFDTTAYGYWVCCSLI